MEKLQERLFLYVGVPAIIIGGWALIIYFG